MGDVMFFLDPGHGGMVNGKYTTAPDKMYKHPDFVIYEGVINRSICNKLKKLMLENDIPFFDVVSSNRDVSLQTRVDRANSVYKTFQRGVYISLHSNAGKGKGFEVFTSVGDTAADPVASIFLAEITKEFTFPIRKDMTDGDGDKEKNFFVLKNTKMPAVLIESLFFDNYEEAKLLLKPEFQARVAYALFRGIQDIYKKYNMIQ
jgi:N-acetylmuramoyl-L-alanine amidase